VAIHYEEALYQVYAPLSLPLIRHILFVFLLIFVRPEELFIRERTEENKRHNISHDYYSPSLLRLLCCCAAL